MSRLRRSCDAAIPTLHHSTTPSVPSRSFLPNEMLQPQLRRTRLRFLRARAGNVRHFLVNPDCRLPLLLRFEQACRVESRFVIPEMLRARAGFALQTQHVVKRPERLRILAKLSEA